MLLQDLAPNFLLYAVCTDCDRMASVSVTGLLELLPAQTPMDAVRRRVRCRHCGNRTGDIRIVYVGDSHPGGQINTPPSFSTDAQSVGQQLG